MKSELMKTSTRFEKLHNFNTIVETRNYLIFKSKSNKDDNNLHIECVDYHHQEWLQHIPSVQHTVSLLVQQFAQLADRECELLPSIKIVIYFSLTFIKIA